jgi:hypothetical protein
VRFRAQVQSRNQVQLGFQDRRLLRVPSMGPERPLLLRPERLPFPALLRRLLQVPEQGPYKGQALPLLSGGRAHRGKSKCKMQSAKWRNRR